MAVKMPEVRGSFQRLYNVICTFGIVVVCFISFAAKSLTEVSLCRSSQRDRVYLPNELPARQDCAHLHEHPSKDGRRVRGSPGCDQFARRHASNGFSGKRVGQIASAPLSRWTSRKCTSDLLCCSLDRAQRRQLTGLCGQVSNERLFRLVFPERPGALKDFLDTLGYVHPKCNTLPPRNCH